MKNNAHAAGSAKAQPKSQSGGSGEFDNLPLQSSLAIVSHVNDFLDDIGKKGRYAAENEQKILEFVRQMKMLGFNSPFAALLFSTKQELEDAGAEEMADQKKQLSNFRYVAGLKKFTLNRARVALSAHRIHRYAIERLPLPQWLSSLPLGGNYIATLYNAGDYGIVAYKEYSDSFSTKNARSNAVIATVEHEVAGKVTASKFKLTNEKNLQEKVARAYGSGAKVIEVLVAKTQEPLIKNKSVRVALFSAAASFASRQAKETLDAQSGVTSEQMASYKSILKRHGIVADAVLDHIEGFDKAKQEIANAGFGDYDGENIISSKDILAAVKSRRIRGQKIVAKAMADATLMPLARFYSRKSKSAREIAPIFPSLVIVPQQLQSSVLDSLEFVYPSLVGISQAVSGKLEAEGGFPKNVSEDFAIGFFASKGLLKPDALFVLFGADAHKIAQCKSEYESSMSGKGGEFLASLKGGRK